MNIELIGNKCCGCRTCQTACPVKAISFTNDKFGFEQPVVDADKCIDCGKCTKVCPVLNELKESHHLRCGAAYSKEPETKFNGTSGGLFGTFARKVIKEGGVVYGAAFDDSLQLSTRRATSIEELQPLYKSKYLLCNTSDIFDKIKEDLRSGKKVLYCSSPCQVQALRLFLGKDYENLLCLDFVCHGVGSQKMWDDSINYFEKKNGIKILSYTMRYKPNKPSSHYYYYYYRDLKTGREKQNVNIYLKDPYYHAYQKRLICRTSCFDCKFASENRVGDITIADFHTIEKFNKSIDRFAGVSMFVCNTTRGVEYFDSVKDDLFVEEYPWNDIKSENRFDNTERQTARSIAFLELANKDFASAVKKYLNPYKDYTYYYYKMPKFLRLLARKLLNR